MLHNEFVIFLSELKFFSYLSSDQLNQVKGIFFLLLRILHNGESAIACE